MICLVYFPQAVQEQTLGEMETHQLSLFQPCSANCNEMLLACKESCSRNSN